MKKSYTGKKRTTIALDPELTKRIEIMLKNKGMKLSKYTQEVLRSALAVDEMNQTVEFYKKLQDSGQYQKIKHLEGEVKKLKEYHITEKKVDDKFKKLKSQKIDELEKRLNGFEKEKAFDEEIVRYVKEHEDEFPEFKKDLVVIGAEFQKQITKAMKKQWFREGYTEEAFKEFEKEKERFVKKYKKQKHTPTPYKI